MSENKVIKKRNKKSFIERFGRANSSLGFYLGQERFSVKQYDLFMWKLIVIRTEHEKTL